MNVCGQCVHDVHRTLKISFLQQYVRFCVYEPASVSSVCMRVLLHVICGVCADRSCRSIPSIYSAELPPLF